MQCLGVFQVFEMCDFCRLFTGYILFKLVSVIPSFQIWLEKKSGTWYVTLVF